MGTMGRKTLVMTQSIISPSEDMEMTEVAQQCILIYHFSYLERQHWPIPTKPLKLLVGLVGSRRLCFGGAFTIIPTPACRCVSASAACQVTLCGASHRSWAIKLPYSDIIYIRRFNGYQISLRPLPFSHIAPFSKQTIPTIRVAIALLHLYLPFALPPGCWLFWFSKG